MTDLAIIGGGPAGYVAAERAGAEGLSVVLFEKNALGGVCLNEGCIPTKTLLYSAKTYENALHADKYGVSTEGVGFDFAKIVARKNKVVRKLVAGVGAKMKAHNVTVVKGAAMVQGRGPEGITIECEGVTYTSKNLLICTGSEAFTPPIPGLEEIGERVVTAREMLELKERPESVVIIGGGVIGMEFASLYNSLGTRVTVVEMLPEILGGMDGEIAAVLREVYSKKGVDFRLGCRVTRLAENKVFCDSPPCEGEVADAVVSDGVVEGDKILVSIGRRPVTKGFGLETLGVELDRGGIKVDGQMRTNIPGVWAAGDVTGFSMLAHTASREGEVVVANIAGRAETMRYDAVPCVVYTNPEIAAVGLTLDVAKAKGIAGARELKLPMAYSGRFVAENEGVNGICKVVVGEHDEVLGVHLMGGPAGEMIWGASLAIVRGMTVRELREVIFPHPTVSEIIKETLFES
jgi:dihydrolipoamide dehydrogenase